MLNNVEINDLKPGFKLEVPLGAVWITGAGNIATTDCDMSTEGWVKVVDMGSIQVTVPEGFNAVSQLAEGIDKKLAELAEDYHKEKAKLVQRKEELLAISFDGGDE